jgi:hypothetical protein
MPFGCIFFVLLNIHVTTSTTYNYISLYINPPAIIINLILNQQKG